MLLLPDIFVNIKLKQRLYQFSISSQPVTRTMKTNFIYSMSRTLGLYPFDRNGLSKTWLYISGALQIGTAAAYVLNVEAVYPKSSSIKLSNYVDLTFLAVAFASTNCHFFRTILNRNLFDATKATAVRKAPYVVYLAALTQIMWQIVMMVSALSIDPNGMVWKTVPYAQSALTCLIALQFITSISIKSREARKLKRYIGKYPEAACTHLYKIADQVDVIHRAYAPQLIFVLMKLAVCAVHYGFKGLTNNGNLPIGVYLGYAVESLAWVLFIQWPCSSFNQQIQAFHSELFRVIRTRGDLSSDRKMCLYALVQRRVEFRTCGFFTLGYPLFTSTIAAAVTYLVILLQYE